MKVGIHVGVRLPDEDRELLFRVCDARGESVSNFLRKLVRRELASMSYYSDEVKKATGVLSGSKNINAAEAVQET